MRSPTPKQIQRKDWRDDAACLDHPPELWFATRTNGHRDYAWAVRICRHCPVRQPCLEDALRLEASASRNNRFGTRGALSGGARWVLYDAARRASLDIAA